MTDEQKESRPDLRYLKTGTLNLFVLCVVGDTAFHDIFIYSVSLLKVDRMQKKTWLLQSEIKQITVAAVIKQNYKIYENTNF